MKKLLLLFVFFLFSSNQVNSQSDFEIISWINNYEDTYAIERILDGTFSDKVFLYKDSRGYLIIKELIWDSSSPPIILTRIDLSKIIRIFAEPTTGTEMTAIDVNICVEAGYITAEGSKDGKPLRFDFNGYIRDNGYCNESIRLQFKLNNSDKYTQRIINAIAKLAENNGSNPEIGSLF
tara:strand:+ start:109 stop:645 length:537 start_codon:yes stop_codon:yes gene_type:complete